METLDVVHLLSGTVYGRIAARAEISVRVMKIICRGFQKPGSDLHARQNG